MTMAFDILKLTGSNLDNLKHFYTGFNIGLLSSALNIGLSSAYIILSEGSVRADTVIIGGMATMIISSVVIQLSIPMGLAYVKTNKKI